MELAKSSTAAATLAECTEEPGAITRTFLSPAMRGRSTRARVDGGGRHLGPHRCGRQRPRRSRTRSAPADRLAPRHRAARRRLRRILGVDRDPRRLPPCAVEWSFSRGRPLRVRSSSDAEVLVPRRQPCASLHLDDSRRRPRIWSSTLSRGRCSRRSDCPSASSNRSWDSRRFDVQFPGRAGHAGTTPMRLRSDALAAAAEWIGHVERVAQEHRGTGRHGGTDRSVSRRRKRDRRRGAHDPRCPPRVRRNPRRRCRASLRLRRHGIDVERSADDGPAGRRARFCAIARAVEMAGYPVHLHAPSGAGHDAMIMAAKLPASMLFLRSPGGISHHPDETVREEDVDAPRGVSLPRIGARDAPQPVAAILRTRPGSAGGGMKTCTV